MLSTVCRGRLTRVITPSILSSERRYYRPTRAVRSNGDNGKPPTSTTLPTNNNKPNNTNEDADNTFWELNKLLGDRDTQPTQRTVPKTQLKKNEEEKEDIAQTAEWLAAISTMPDLPSTPLIRRGDREESEENSKVTTGSEREEPEFESRDEAKLEEAMEVSKSKEEKILVQKYQKKGMWDDAKARELVDKALSEKRDELRKRGKADLDTPESATARNQKYKLGEVTLSIEHADDATIRRHTEHTAEVAARSQELIDRKEEAIVADEDPTLVDALLDRPSQIDKIFAGKKGEELMEFYSQEELEEFEANKGKLSDEKTTKSRAQILYNSKRGPAITKNEQGAESISLLYDEEPPQDRAIARFYDPLKRLKYLPIYPQKMRKWVTHCKGRYDKWGYWENDVKLQENENTVRDQLKVRARQLGDTGMLLMVEKRKRQTLAPDLDGHYRFGVQSEELVGVHPKVKEMMSFRHANNTEIHTFRKQQLIKRWQERPDDHGTPQVQIACMTNRVNYLTDHLKKNKKDKQCRLSLRKLLSRRQSMLKYLRRTNVPIYYQIVRELDIQDVSF